MVGSADHPARGTDEELDQRHAQREDDQAEQDRGQIRTNRLERRVDDRTGIDRGRDHDGLNSLGS